jgi:membrane associated rhomboid family serine protease
MTTNNPEIPVLPVARQPVGRDYFIGTWSGRLLLINIIVFAGMVWINPSSFLTPSNEFIRMFGSKSVADIASGEYWRFITPMFVHIGIIHLFFNSLGIYYVAYQIELILGARWFVILYLLAGIVGNLASCLFSLTLSAGASGALFGLLGAGFRLERVVGKSPEMDDGSPRPRKRVYAGMVISNLILGLVIPVIDNSAHIGGVITGWLLMDAVLRSRPNRFMVQKPWISKSIYAAIAGFMVFAVARTVDPVVVSKRYLDAGLKSSDAPTSYQSFSNALKVLPSNELARIKRGTLLLQNGEVGLGVEDIRMAIQSGRITNEQVDSIIEELQLIGRNLEAEMVGKLSQKME